jgi:hypothetical protein
LTDSGRWPRGVRLTVLDGTWWRIDGEAPTNWSWAPFPSPRQRFDSAEGRFRTRYAARSARGALREAFDGTGRVLAPVDLDRQLVRLRGRLRVIDLRREAILDAFGLDDRISTARDPQTWARCHELIDQIVAHYGIGGESAAQRPFDGVVYRSRTTPQTSANLAFLGRSALTAQSLGPLRDSPMLLATAVVADGFTVLGADSA